MTKKETALLHVGRLEQHLALLQEQIQQLWVEVEALAAPELTAKLAGPEAAHWSWDGRCRQKFCVYKVNSTKRRRICCEKKIS